MSKTEEVLDDRLEGHSDLNSSHWLLWSLLIIGVLILTFFVLGYVLNWDWVGVGENTQSQFNQEFHRSKTLWDWMDLLIVPVILALGLYLLNQSARRSEQKIARENRSEDNEIARKARETDREIAKNRQEQIALENFYDQMEALLLEHDLQSKTDESDVERSIARARTLTVLRMLNEDRKGQVISFLYETELISAQDPIIVLSTADLRKANLYGANLGNASLHNSNLTRANLYLAYLLGADLSRAGMFEADLHRAVLREANLRNAVLVGARLTRADLDKADLHRAMLSGADLRWARLQNADLSEAILKGDSFTNLHIIEAAVKVSDPDPSVLKKDYTHSANLDGARYNESTKWPSGFDPRSAGAVLVDNNDFPIELKIPK